MIFQYCQRKLKLLNPLMTLELSLTASCPLTASCQYRLMLLCFVDLDSFTSDNYVQLFDQWQPPPPKQQSRHLSAVVWTTATPCCTACQTAFCGRSVHSQCRCTSGHRSSTMQPHHAGAASAALAACSSASQVQGCMPGTPVAGWSDSCIHSRRHPTRYGQWSPWATFSRRQDMLRSTAHQTCKMRGGVVCATHLFHSMYKLLVLGEWARENCRCRRRFWHATIRLRSTIHRHHPPQRAVLSQICCFGSIRCVVSDPVGRCWATWCGDDLVVFSSLLDGSNRILLAPALSSMCIICPNRVSQCDWIIAVSMGCIISLRTSSFQANWYHWCQAAYADTTGQVHQSYVHPSLISPSSPNQSGILVRCTCCTASTSLR